MELADVFAMVGSEWRPAETTGLCSLCQRGVDTRRVNSVLQLVPSPDACCEDYPSHSATHGWLQIMEAYCQATKCQMRKHQWLNDEIELVRGKTKLEEDKRVFLTHHRFPSATPHKLEAGRPAPSSLRAIKKRQEGKQKMVIS